MAFLALTTTVVAAQKTENSQLLPRVSRPVPIWTLFANPTLKLGFPRIENHKMINTIIFMDNLFTLAYGSVYANSAWAKASQSFRQDSQPMSRDDAGNEW